MSNRTSHRLFENRLLVEGLEEVRVLPTFLDSYVEWGNTENDWIVHLRQMGGVGTLKNRKVIRTELNEPGLRALGVIVDADSDPAGRWRSLREASIEAYPSFPETPPANGLIVAEPDEIRFGAWLMPDNSAIGALESMMTRMIRPEAAVLWNHAVSSTIDAKGKGATYKDCHLEKAKLYAYLAWMDTPGMSFKKGLMKGLLDPNSLHAQSFVEWFCALFQLNRRPAPVIGA